MQYGAAWGYLLADALGSVRQTIDVYGNVTLAESYEPYGSVLNSTGTASSIFAYAGEEVDTSGLIYLRARYMQPTLGIFLARDPWNGEALRPDSMNGSGYVEGDPINKADPSSRNPSDSGGPRPWPYAPEFNRNDLFPFNGYIEGVSFVSQIASQIVGIAGREIVYDFVTHQRAEFIYQGYKILLGTSCGMNFGTAWGEGSANAYVGTYDFLASDARKWLYERKLVYQDVIEEYQGPFFNYFINASTPSWSALIAPNLKLPISANGGVNIFCSAPLHVKLNISGSDVIDIPALDLQTTKCGASISLGVGTSSEYSELKYAPASGGMYFTDYTGNPFSVRNYSGRDPNLLGDGTGLNAMINDIISGNQTPIGLAQAAMDSLLSLSRSRAAIAAREIWTWQDKKDRGMQ